MGAAILHSGTGLDNSTDLFWGKNVFVWNNGGDIATLRDPAGTIVSVYTY